MVDPIEGTMRKLGVTATVLPDLGGTKFQWDTMATQRNKAACRCSRSATFKRLIDEVRTLKWLSVAIVLHTFFMAVMRS